MHSPRSTSGGDASAGARARAVCGEGGRNVEGSRSAGRRSRPAQGPRLGHAEAVRTRWRAWPHAALVRAVACGGWNSRRERRERRVVLGCSCSRSHAANETHAEAAEYFWGCSCSRSHAADGTHAESAENAELFWGAHALDRMRRREFTRSPRSPRSPRSVFGVFLRVIACGGVDTRRLVPCPRVGPGGREQQHRGV